MRVNVPLLPFSVDVQRRAWGAPYFTRLEWRVLGPPRISLRRLMIGVAIVAAYFALCAYMARLNSAMKYHTEEARKAGTNSLVYRSLGHEIGDPFGARWHMAMAQRYRASYEVLEPLPSFLFLGFAGVCGLTLFGRLLNGLAPQPVKVLQHESAQHP